MVKDHSDSKRGNLLLPNRLLFLISSKWVFYTSYGTLAVMRNMLISLPLGIDPKTHHTMSYIQQLYTWMKEQNILFNDTLNTFLFIVIQHEKYG